MSKSSCLCTDMDNGFLLIFHIVELRQLKLNFVLLEAVSMRSENPTIRSTPSLGSYHNVAFETVRLTDDGPLLSFQGRSSSASSFYCCLLQAIDCVMSLALCPQVVSQAPQHFRSSEKLATCEGCFFPASLSSRSFPFTPACPGKHIRRSFRRWMSTIDTFQSGLPIPLFTFCSKICEDDCMCGLTVTS